MSTPVVLTVADWNTSSIKYMAPKINKSGGKAISVISNQTKRSLHISTPLMMTWGVSDFVDDKGDSDGKFGISLNFPMEGHKNPATDTFLQKLKDFENQILDDAVKNSELWWGEEMSREVAKHTFFPILKYSKNKDTKKIDHSKPPSIRAKVPNYEGKWAVEIYDTKQNMIFPCENENLTPVDFIPKMSQVACVLQCGGIWIGGKGWGLTWKLVQCVVKPREIVSVYGRCQIKLSAEETETLESQEINEDVDHPEEESVPASRPAASTVEDSDGEEDAVPEQKVSEPEPVVEKPAAAAPVKKVVKKAAPAPEPAAAPAAAPAEAPKKKVIKKAAP